MAATAAPSQPVQLDLPAGFLADAEYRREGDDLVLVGPDGQEVVVPGYWAGGGADLVSGNARIPADLVRSLTPRQVQLAAADGDVAFEQVAQASGGAQPIGKVATLSGTVTALRTDGTKVVLKNGDPVFQRDVIETTADGKVNLVLADNTNFALGEGGRMRLDELIYDQSAKVGSMSLSVLKGAFAFATGAIAPLGTDAMVVKTPVGTIGIRGTEVSGVIGADNNVIQVDHGNVVFTNGSGFITLTPGASMAVVSYLSSPATASLSQTDMIRGLVETLRTAVTAGTKYDGGNNQLIVPDHVSVQGQTALAVQGVSTSQAGDGTGKLGADTPLAPPAADSAPANPAAAGNTGTGATGSSDSGFRGTQSDQGASGSSDRTASQSSGTTGAGTRSLAENHQSISAALSQLTDTQLASVTQSVRPDDVRVITDALNNTPTTSTTTPTTTTTTTTPTDTGTTTTNNGGGTTTTPTPTTTTDTGPTGPTVVAVTVPTNDPAPAAVVGGSGTNDSVTYNYSGTQTSLSIAPSVQGMETVALNVTGATVTIDASAIQPSSDGPTTINLAGGSYVTINNMRVNLDATQYKGGLTVNGGGDTGLSIVGGYNDTDTVIAGDGDSLTGANGADTIGGGNGNDTINGGNGADVLAGDSGDDLINGGNGADTVNGGTGNDTIDGGDGADLFVYNNTGTNGVDSVANLTVGDRFQFTGATLTDRLSSGQEISVQGGQAVFLVNGGTTDLYVGRDAAMGADEHIVLDGVYRAGLFELSGSTITYIGEVDPDAGDDTVTGAFDTAMTISGATLLANDTDRNGDSFSITAVGGAVHGTVSLSGSDVIFTPDTGFSGTASFTYTIDDGQGGTPSTATVDVTVPGDVDKALVNGLGGTAGFGEGMLARGDDSIYAQVDVSSVIGNGLRIGDSFYNAVYVNTNGHITFTVPDYRYVPETLDASLLGPSSQASYSMIAAFWSDIDTRSTSGLHTTSGGNSTGSNGVYYDVDSDSRTLTATWDDVGQYSNNNTYLNAFQIQIVAVGTAGDFDVLLRYEDVEWARGGSVRAGLVIGGVAYELAASGSAAAIEALESTAGNTGVDGVWRFEVRDGVLQLEGQTLSGSSDADSLVGTGGNDSILGQADGDTLIGAAGNDTLVGGSGDNSLLGGAGNDSLVGGDDGNTLVGGLGDDTMYGGEGIDSFDVEGGTDLIVDLDVDDTITANAAISSLSVSYDSDGDYTTLTINHVSAGSQTVRIDGEWTDDDFEFSGSTITVIDPQNQTVDDQIYGGNGDDTLDGGIGDDTIYGYIGNDCLIGGDGNDSLIGESGNDTLVGGNGNDTLVGGNDVDTFVIGTGQGTDRLVGLGIGDRILAGSGNISTSSWSFDSQTGTTSGQIIPSGGGSINLVLDGEWTKDQFEVSGNTLTVGTGDQNLSFTSSNDIEFGGRGNDTLLGLGGNDCLAGNSDNDSLLGGDGNDTLIGGNGHDTLYGGDGIDRFVFAANAWTDLIADLAVGETIVFGQSIDSFSSGYSNGQTILTIYPVNSNDATSIYLTGEFDAGQFSVDSVSGTVTVLTADDSILGTSGSDSLQGSLGNDTITGDAADDTLEGGAGNDSLLGGADNDSLYGGSGNDTLLGDSGNDVMVGDTGNDSLVGGDGDDSLTGDVGSDTLSGGAGNDTLVGGTDDDDTFVIGVSEGTDRLAGLNVGDRILVGSGNISTSSWSYDSQTDTTSLQVIPVGGGSADLRLDGEWQQSQFSVVGNVITLGARNDLLVGTDDADTLDGGAGNDTISGGLGDDSLLGGSGDDSLLGGDGADTLVAGTGNDTLVGGDGSDTFVVFRNSTARIMDVEVGETIVLGDLGAGFDGTSSSANGDNSVTLTIGYNSSDPSTVIIHGISDTDQITHGFDTQTSSFTGTFTINDGSHNAFLQGSTDWVHNAGVGNDSTYGNIGNDSLMGGSGDDSILGNDGTDTLVGGTGNDTLLGEAGNDSLTGGDGNDSLVGGADNNTLYGGDGGDTLVGGEGDFLYGGAGNDSIVGGAGADFIEGGAGNDTLTGGNGGGDVYVLNSGEGTDRITDLGNGDIISVTGGDGGNSSSLSVSEANNVTTVTISGLAGSDITLLLDGSYGSDRFDFNGSLISVVSGDVLPEQLRMGIDAPDSIDPDTAAAAAAALTGGDNSHWVLGETRTLTYSLWGDMSQAMQDALDRAFDAWESTGLVHFQQVDASGSAFNNHSDISVVFGGAPAAALLPEAGDQLAVAFRPDADTASAESTGALPADEGSVVGAVAVEDHTVEAGEHATRAGDIVLDHEVEGAGLDEGELGYYALLHEIGHALGLADPSAAGLGSGSAYDHADWTVMSYNAGTAVPSAPGALDILALQQIYGGTPSASATAILESHVVPAAEATSPATLSAAADDSSASEAPAHEATTVAASGSASAEAADDHVAAATSQSTVAQSTASQSTTGPATTSQSTAAHETTTESATTSVHDAASTTAANADPMSLLESLNSSAPAAIAGDTPAATSDAALLDILDSPVAAADPAPADEAPLAAAPADAGYSVAEAAAPAATGPTI